MLTSNVTRPEKLVLVLNDMAWASSDPRTRKISKKTSDKIPKKILESGLGSSRHQDLGAWTSRQSMFAMVIISLCSYLCHILCSGIHTPVSSKYKYSYSIRYLISHYIVTMNTLSEFLLLVKMTEH